MISERKQHTNAKDPEDDEMQRITVTLDDELVAAIDQLIVAAGYQNRSEVLRDLARSGLAQASDDAADDQAAVAALVYVYDHEARELAKRLTRSFHDHHDLSLATTHVHLDHRSCMEVAVLKGAMREIRRFAQQVIAERGVRHGRLVSVPAEFQDLRHSHGAAPAHRHLHTHVREAGASSPNASREGEREAQPDRYDR